MQREIREHFGMRRSPVGGVRNKEDIYFSTDFSVAQTSIIDIVLEDGWMALIGSIGAGKTTIMREAIELLNKSERIKAVDVISLDRERLKISGIMSAMILDLSEETPKRMQEFRERQLRRILGEVSREHKIALLIDEAHLLWPPTLLALKRLRELAWGRRCPLFSTVLIGQPALKHKLEKLTEVNLRCAQIEIQGMTAGEAREYIEKKFASAGVEIVPMNDEALEMLSSAGRFPLAINNTLAQALELAYYSGRDKVEKGDIEIALGPQLSLREKAERLNLTTTAIGKAMGKHKAIISRILNGRPGDSQKSYKAIEDFLDGELESRAQVAATK